VDFTCAQEKENVKESEEADVLANERVKSASIAFHLSPIYRSGSSNLIN
jgi:hypothetical protein